MRFKRTRRILFRLAFKGCRADDALALAYAKRVSLKPSLEDEIRIERALTLDYFAMELGR